MNSSHVKSQSGEVSANDIIIAYESFGKSSDQAIVLIQGVGATLLHWPIEFCQKLANLGYRVIRFDNRDIGLSTKFDSLGQPDWGAIIPFVKTCENAPLPYTLLDMANDVIGLMDGLNIDKAHIVGVSMGGAIAQLIAIHFPERIYTLTSISASSGNPNLPMGDEKALQAMSTPPPTTTNPDTLANYLVHVYKALGGTDDDETLKKRALAHMDRSWYPEGTNRQVAAVLIGDNCDRRESLAKIGVPTMVIHGDSDPLVTLASGQEVAATIPNAELIIVKGLGHDLSMEFVDILVDSILANVKKLNRITTR
jgi:pimeloyl-ACP methyl ester carboxylesterase